LTKLIKKLLLAQTSRQLIGYCNYLIRRCYTTTHRNVDRRVDESIRYLTLSRLYELPLDKMELEYYDPILIEEIAGKIDQATNNTIDRLRSDCSWFIEIVRDAASNDKFSYKKIPFSSTLDLYRTAKTRRRDEYEYFRNINRVKVKLSFDQIGIALVVVAPILLVGGILQQYLLSLEFHYAMEMVLSTEDYITSSITTILFAVVPFAISFLVLAFAFLSDMGNQPRLSRRKTPAINWPFWFILIVFLSMTGYCWFVRPEVVPIFAALTIYWLVFNYLFHVIPRYFVNGRTVLALATFILLFLTNVYIGTEAKITEFKSVTTKADVLDIENDEFKARGLKVVTVGSKNDVLLEVSTGAVYLVKPEKVVWMKISK